MIEVLENQKYKNVIKTALQEGSDFCPMRKEKQMDYLFAALVEDFEKKNLQILDACCGYGRLIYFLNKFDPEQFYTGIDYLQELVDKGKNMFSESSNITLSCLDVFEISNSYLKEFDIAINYKTMSWLPYYSKLMKELFAVTKSKIYITSLFYDGDFDFITKIYADAQNCDDDNFTYLNTYSLPKFKKYCLSLGAKHVNAIDMNVDFDLPEPDNINKLQTYTVLKNDGSRLEITGSVILNWKLVEVVLN